MIVTNVLVIEAKAPKAKCKGKGKGKSKAKSNSKAKNKLLLLYSLLVVYEREMLPTSFVASLVSRGDIAKPS